MSMQPQPQAKPEQDERSACVAECMYVAGYLTRELATAGYAMMSGPVTVSPPELDEETGTVTVPFRVASGRVVHMVLRAWPPGEEPGS